MYRRYVEPEIIKQALFCFFLINFSFKKILKWYDLIERNKKELDANFTVSFQSKPTYIRAKNEKTTLFLCIETKDTLDQVKTKLCQALDNKKTNDEVRLLVDGKNKGGYTVLENTKTLENNSIVYFVYYDRNEGNQQQWK